MKSIFLLCLLVVICGFASAKYQVVTSYANTPCTGTPYSIQALNVTNCTPAACSAIAASVHQKTECVDTVTGCNVGYAHAVIYDGDYTCSDESKVTSHVINILDTCYSAGQRYYKTYANSTHFLTSICTDAACTLSSCTPNQSARFGVCNTAGSSFIKATLVNPVTPVTTTTPTPGPATGNALAVFSATAILFAILVSM